MTSIAADGTSKSIQPESYKQPALDCFYVYPTVSAQKTTVANLKIEQAQLDVANAQASRFSSVCRVFAPMYRQLTIAGILGQGPNGDDAKFGYNDVKAAWNDYLDHDNNGRGVILIGHSQGTFVLTSLIAKEIETNPNASDRIVSALLIGGNVTVPEGELVGGSFKKIPVCTAANEFGCVVAYSAFKSAPVEGSLFGAASDGSQVVCTNPAALQGGTAELHPAFPVGPSLLGGIGLTKAKFKTSWVTYPGLLSAECKSNGSYTWLQINEHRTDNDARPALPVMLGPTWGLHLLDINVAYNDLLSLAQSQGDAWQASH